MKAQHLQDNLASLLAIMLDGMTSKQWMAREQALKALKELGIVFTNVKDKPEVSLSTISYLFFLIFFAIFCELKRKVIVLFFFV